MALHVETWVCEWCGEETDTVRCCPEARDEASADWNADIERDL